MYLYIYTYLNLPFLLLHIFQNTPLEEQCGYEKKRVLYF